MTRIPLFAFLALAIALLAAPAVQAGDYIIEQTVNGGYNKYIKGQTFTPGIGINPDPGAVAHLNLTSITFYRSAQPWVGPTSNFYLNIYDGDPVNGSGAFVGSSSHSVDVATLSNLDPIPWTFDSLTLSTIHEYWALVSSTDTAGGLDVYCGMRECGPDLYAGGTAIGGNAGDPTGYLVKTNDVAFGMVLRDTGYFIEQTVNGGYNAYIKGQTFTPSIGINPDPGTVSTLDLKAMTFYRSAQGWSGPSSDFYLNIYDGDPVNGSGAFVGSSIDTVDVATLSNLDPIPWTFDYLTLDSAHEYWALVSSTDTAGGLDVYCGMRECGPDLYAGGTAIGGKSSDPSGYLVKTNDLAFELRLVDTQSFMIDAELLSEITGGVVNFTLHAGSGNAMRDYIILGSITGTSPGLLMPGGMVTLPLEWDIFTDMVLFYANGPFMPNFKSTTDGEGHSTAQLDTGGPLPAGLVGVQLYFAYTLYSPPWNYCDFASNSVMIEIVP